MQICRDPSGVRKRLDLAGGDEISQTDVCDTRTTADGWWLHDVDPATRGLHGAPIVQTPSKVLVTLTTGGS